jgi:hypothetical protein
MSVFPFLCLSTNAPYSHFTRLPQTPYYLWNWECCYIKHLHTSISLSHVLTFKFCYLPSAIKSNSVIPPWNGLIILYRMVKSKELTGRLRLKCDGPRAETRFCLSAKRTSPFKSAGASVQSTTGSRGLRISRSNARYTMFRGSVKRTGYPPHSPVFPSLPPRASPCAITFQLDSTTEYLTLYTRCRTNWCSNGVQL